MFNGKSFATMILVRDGSSFTGSVTPSRIALNDDGGLRRADPTEDSTPSLITKAKLEGFALHVTVGDGNEPVEFIVTLKDDTHAEIHPIGAPPNMKPIPAEKVGSIYPNSASLFHSRSPFLLRLERVEQLGAYRIPRRPAFSSHLV